MYPEIIVLPAIRLDWSPLAAFRRRCSLSQSELARAVGVSTKTIYRIERNRTRPSADLAVQIARAMGKPWHDLVRVVEIPKR